MTTQGPVPTVSETVLGTSAHFIPLTAHDRCDVGECGARAYVRVQFRTGLLLFCAHHYTIHGATHQLQVSSVSIHDERDRLTDSRLDVSA